MSPLTTLADAGEGVPSFAYSRFAHPSAFSSHLCPLPADPPSSVELHRLQKKCLVSFRRCACDHRIVFFLLAGPRILLSSPTHPTLCAAAIRLLVFSEDSWRCTGLQLMWLHLRWEWTLSFLSLVCPIIVSFRTLPCGREAACMCAGI